MLLLAGLPILTTAVAAGSGDVSAEDFDEVLLNGFFATAIVPLVVLAAATASFGNELEDRTLSNLTLSPLPRWKIVLPKLFATISVGAPILLVSLVISVSIAYEGDATVIAASVIAVLLTIVAYSAVFLWLGLSSSRALVVGLLYVFLWEFLFAGFISGIRFLSIRAYMLGIIKGLDDRRFPDNDLIISFPVSLVVMLAIIGIFTALAVRRLRTMDVP
jgi:ABC-2 type transport system permease protein